MEWRGLLGRRSCTLVVWVMGMCMLRDGWVISMQCTVEDCSGKKLL